MKLTPIALAVRGAVVPMTTTYADAPAGSKYAAQIGGQLDRLERRFARELGAALAAYRDTVTEAMQSVEGGTNSERLAAAGALAELRTLDAGVKAAIKDGLARAFNAGEDAIDREVRAAREGVREYAWDEGKHPRAPAGSTTGGQWVVVGYHGTHEQDIDVFDRLKGPARRQGMQSLNEIGVWFAASKEDAQRHGPVVLERELRMTKPWRGTIEKLRNAWADLQRGSTPILKADPSFRLGKGDPEKFRAWMKLHGYDGLHIYKGEHGSDYYVVTEPEQVRRFAWDEGKHPRHPEGSEQGGEFARKYHPQIDNPSFRDWFGDSKVVGPDGKPLVVYHGTSKDDDFGAFRVGQRGAFFTSDPKAASDYAMDNDQMNTLDAMRTGKNRASRVMPVYLSVRNPYVMNEADTAEYVSAKSYRKAQQNIADRARAKGHDGVLYPGGVWVAFKPEQIKSASGNRGTFDPASPRITYAEWDEAKHPRHAAGNEQGGEFKSVEPSYMGANMPWMRTDDGRFTIYKYNAKTRGSSAVKGQQYSVWDSQTPAGSKPTFNFQNLGYVNSFIHHRRTGEQTAPWFGGDKPEAPKAAMVKHPNWADFWDVPKATGAFGGMRPEPGKKDFAEWHEADHPREPSGSDEGGQFARKQTDSKEFKYWFGSSKVVDEQGKPLVVYHGTSTPTFDKFQDRGGMGGPLGFWFASSGEAASQFARNRYAGQGGAIYPVFLKIENPMQYHGWHEFVDHAKKLQKGGTIEAGVKSLRRSLRQRGYDGVVIRGSDTDMGGKRDDWVAFDSRQIKSATGNRGTFDPNDKRITFGEWDEDAHPRHPAGDARGGEFAPKGDVFHVTETKNVAKIKKQGLKMFQPTNWEQRGSRERYGDGSVFAFESEVDAHRWAARMDWEFHKSTGSGKVSILRVRPDAKPWQIDDADPLSQSSAKGRWLKRARGVSPDNIGESTPFTIGMAKALVKSNYTDDLTGIHFADWDESKHPRQPAGTNKGGEFAGKTNWYITPDFTMKMGYDENQFEVINARTGERIGLYPPSWADRVMKVNDQAFAREHVQRVRKAHKYWEKDRWRTVSGRASHGAERLYDSIKNDYVRRGYDDTVRTEGLTAADRETQNFLQWNKREKQFAEGDTTIFRPLRAIDYLSSKLFWVTGILEADLTKAIRDVLVASLIGGDTWDVVVENVREVFAPFLMSGAQDRLLPDHRLLTIVRTNTMDAYNHGRLAEMMDPDVLPFLDGVRYSAILDTRTTEVCRYLHGKVFHPTDPALETLMPPNHFNCRSVLVPLVLKDDLTYITPAEAAEAESLADASFLAKKFSESWDESKHPRHDAGSREGGRFRPHDHGDGAIGGESPEHRIDNPGGGWLAEQRKLTWGSGRDEFGAPKRFGAVTGTFSDKVLVPVDMLAAVPGMRGEQSRVRASSLASLVEYMGTQGKLPPGPATSGEYAPFVMVDADGKPWMNEGNHRTMAAKQLGWKYLPVEVRYFAGGERDSGAWNPAKLLATDKRLRGTPRYDRTKAMAEWNEADHPRDTTKPGTNDGSFAPKDGDGSQRPKQTDTDAFKTWFGDSQVVDEDGNPLVVYHGTTHDFDQFKPKLTNAENDFGQGIYMTTNPRDVSDNYAGEGPDLTQRIQIRAERIAGSRNWEYDDPRALAQARKELSGGAPNVMPLYVRMENPLVLGGDKPTFMDEKEARKFTRSIEKAIGKDISHRDIAPAVAELQEYAFEGGRADKLIALARTATMYAEDSKGDLIGNELVRRAIQRAGYDGIIDKTVSDKWGATSDRKNKMVGVDENTAHYIAFDAKQVKSAIGNRGTFDPKSPVITHAWDESKRRRGKTTDASTPGSFAPTDQAKAADEAAMAEVLAHGRANKTEMGILYDPVTGERLFTNLGEAHHVQFTDEQLAQFVGRTMVHNHPSSSSLSKQDVHMAYMHKLREIVAVAHLDGTRYGIKPEGANFGVAATAAGDDAIKSVFWPLVMKKQITGGDAEIMHNHILWTAVYRVGGVGEYSARLGDKTLALFQKNQPHMEAALKKVRSELVEVGYHQWDEKIKLFAWDESQHPRGTTTAGTNDGSFAGSSQRGPGREVGEAAAVAALLEHERTTGHEMAIVIDPDTGEELFRKAGTAQTVSFEKHELRPFIGKVFIHNHPVERSLSPADLEMASKYGMREIVAVTKDGSRYGASISGYREQLFDMANVSAFSTLVENVRDGKIAQWEADIIHPHVINKVLHSAKEIRDYTAKLGPKAAGVMRDRAAVIDEATRYARGILESMGVKEWRN